MSAPRPVIGVTAGEERASYGDWSARQVTFVPSEYIRAVERCGGAPLLVPVQPDRRAVARIAGLLDGVLLTGGRDVDPELYEAAPHPLTQRPRADRDRFELALLEEVTTRRLPTLAVCRGVQVLNVARGGSLHQHLPDVVGHDGHSPKAGEYVGHPVSVAPGSLLHSVLGRSEVDGPAHHHQSVDRVGEGLRPVAWADDGTIEALEGTDGSFLIGVQWHPEVGDDGSLFEGLVRAAGG
jgi:gamma-glutamyl-gamma-aminobutyrate hydrolase PuuD